MNLESLSREGTGDRTSLGREDILAALEAEYAKGRDPLVSLDGQSDVSVKEVVSGLEQTDIDYWNLVQNGDLTIKDDAAYRAALKDASPVRKRFAQFARNKAQTIIMQKEEMDQLDKEYAERHHEPDEHDQTLRI